MNFSASPRLFEGFFFARARGRENERRREARRELIFSQDFSFGLEGLELLWQAERVTAGFADDTGSRRVGDN